MEYTNCWLQYPKLSDTNTSELILYYETEGKLIENAVNELKLAFHSLYNRRIHTVKDINYYRRAQASIKLRVDTSIMIGKEGYSFACSKGKCTISAVSELGLLYGVFAFTRRLQFQQVMDYDDWTYSEEKEPSNPLRMLNHWDNLDGSIERGYSGNSFFFHNNQVLVNERTAAYARMLASIHINAVVINNVNVKGAATELISDRYYANLCSMAKLFSSYGVRLFLSINFAAPINLGGLDTADPCEDRVNSWWIKKAEEIWSNIPELGGFLVKADSEGRPGPFSYGRTHADGANMLAAAVRPYKGLVIWRCFVYNCQQDWRDMKTDRSKAGYDNFMHLDGNFLDNVILQIKNGPMDFQVREPVSPLFGALKKTNIMLEVQIAQEYTGQQRHVCFLIPWFKEILNTKMNGNEEQYKIEEIVSGRTYHNSNCGMAAVANSGNDENWTGHDLAAANFYGFGRLSYDTKLTGEDIAYEWIVQTLGNDEKVKATVHKILMKSWLTYEKYTSPLGIGWMVKPNIHYGPDVDGYEFDRWGTYHRADHKAIGVNRGIQGTGFSNQYHEPLATIYSDRRNCPEELILFFHRLEYEYVLSSGKTVLQHIYDSHFEGAKEAEEFLNSWKELLGLVEVGGYHRVLERLSHQKEHAKEWRDVINSYFYRKTGIPDRYGRIIY